MVRKNQIYCGVFDSRVSRKNMTDTLERTVRHYEIELHHINGGICYMDQSSHPIRAGMLLCAKPGQVRHTHLPSRCSYIWVLPDEDTKSILNTLPSCVYLENPNTIESLLRMFTQLNITTIEAAPEPERNAGINAAFYQILYSILRLCREDNGQPMPKRLVQEIYRYIDQHFCEKCTLKKIADHIHMSANHLHTIFLKSEGKTPSDYVAEKRIERAKTMILMEETSLAQIAHEIGFCSQSHFTSVFKKHTGLTPAQYRKRLFDMTV